MTSAERARTDGIAGTSAGVRAATPRGQSVVAPSSVTEESGTKALRERIGRRSHRDMAVDAVNIAAVNIAPSGVATLESSRTAVVPSRRGPDGPNVAETQETREHNSNGDSCGQWTPNIPFGARRYQ